ncbi:Asp23/Gls24 family envelope stress response protein [Weissella koreensis]|uniref:Stress response regulator gls24 homolog n=1 Tax=Weissella koreensis TaxID=165096 RepID=A0A7H1MN87_9LACO|nr:Asp23/Gls24 family envelope stress response protein [Weissella koreensis]AVH75721.1 Asp23/Gls24 family envelope stress response protein [Weissella koreensis]QGN20942.1 Asp23/Gls24 family envelope stress response protein [Weissella koreensis]QNT64923.1 Asp23/Gls24 family envelope stress response protein [Weissella koreensis]
MEKGSNKNQVIKGDLTFDDKVIQKIVGYSIEKIDGLLGIDAGFIANVKNKLVNSSNPTEGVEVEVGKEQVAVDLDIITEFGKDARTIYQKIQELVKTKIMEMTGLELIELNVKVVDIQTAREFNKNQVTLQDKAGDMGQTIKDKTKDGYDSVKDNLADNSENRGERVK